LDILACFVGAARGERGEPVPGGLVREARRQKGGREMSNEEIVKVLQQMSAFACSIEEREALEAAIARLSAPARTEWVILWRFLPEHRPDEDADWIEQRFRTEPEAQEWFDTWEDDECEYCIMERQIVETVKEW
jgi:hypothetical protein